MNKSDKEIEINAEADINANQVVDTNIDMMETEETQKKKRRSLKSYMKAFSKSNKIAVEYFGFKWFMSIMHFFSFKSVMSFAGRLGSMLYHVLKRSRLDALEGLSIAFPEKTEEERERIAKSSFKNMIITFIEFAYTSKYSDDKLASTIKVEGFENLENALKKNCGAVVITGHIGNWENIAAVASMAKMQPAFIIRAMDNPKIGKHVSNWRTKRGGSEIVRKRGDLRDMFQTLRDNKPIGILSDQNYSSGVFVYFFGKLACTASGSIAIAMKTKSPILFAFDKRNEDYTHTVTFSEEMLLDVKETKEKTILYNTQKYTKVLEDYIRENPEDWLWVHKRWNTYPEEREKALNYARYDEY